MAEHLDGRHAKQAQWDHQSINQWEEEGETSQYKLVRLSKTTTGEIKIVLKWQIYQTKDRSLTDTGEDIKEAGDWGAALQC